MEEKIVGVTKKAKRSDQEARAKGLKTATAFSGGPRTPSTSIGR